MPNKRDASGQRLLTVKQVAKLAGVEEKLVVSHVQELWAGGNPEKLRSFIPIVKVDRPDDAGRCFRIRESDALQFKAGKPGKLLPRKG